MHILSAHIIFALFLKKRRYIIGGYPIVSKSLPPKITRILRELQTLYWLLSWAKVTFKTTPFLCLFSYRWQTNQGLVVHCRLWRLPDRNSGLQVYSLVVLPMSHHCFLDHHCSLSHHWSLFFIFFIFIFFGAFSSLGLVVRIFRWDPAARLFI